MSEKEHIKDMQGLSSSTTGLDEVGKKQKLILATK